MSAFAKLSLAAVLGAALSFSAHALTIAPTIPPSELAILASGNQTSQSQINSAIAPFIGSATEQYKNDVPNTESGPLAGSYSTTYSPPTDPEDAVITYTGGPIITGSKYLLIKDGNQEPAWYLFDISSWNGTDTINIENFWPNQGAISHVAIYGGSGDVPDGGLTIALLGFGLTGLGMLRRKLALAR